MTNDTITMDDTITLSDAQERGLVITQPAQTFLILAQDKANVEVVRVEVNGDVYHRGVKCESDADYRAAFQSVINLMRKNYAA